MTFFQERISMKYTTSAPIEPRIGFVGATRWVALLLVSLSLIPLSPIALSSCIVLFWVVISDATSWATHRVAPTFCGGELAKSYTILFYLPCFPLAIANFAIKSYIVFINDYDDPKMRRIACQNS